MPSDRPSQALAAFAREVGRGVPTAAEAPPDKTAIELELRFPRPDGETFATFIETLAEQTGELSMVSAQARTTFDTHEQAESERGLRSSTVQERVYVRGRRTETKYRVKSQVVPTEQVRRHGTVLYSIALAREIPQERAEIVVEDRVIYRGKARMSFKWTLEGHTWLIDATIVRESADVKVAMAAFKDLGTRRYDGPGDFAAAARDLSKTSDPLLAPPTFEVEAEYAGAADGTAPPTRPDLDNMARLILGNLNPKYLVSAQYQETLGVVNRILTKNRGARNDRGARGTRELRLKQILPQVRALDRQVYASLYPRILAGEFYATPKADGIRALAILYTGRIVVLAGEMKVYEATVSREDPGDNEPPRAILDGELVEEKGAATFYPFDALHRVEALQKELGAGDAPRVAEIPFAGRLSVIRALLPFYDVLKSSLTFTMKPFARLKGAAVKMPSGVSAGAGTAGTGAGTASAGADTSGVGTGAVIGVTAAPSPEDVAALAENIARLLRPPKAYPFEIDGLVFIEAQSPYMTTSSYKWKPPSHKTVDVLVRRPPKAVGETAARAAGVRVPKGETLYFLFVGISPAARTARGLALCAGYGDLFRQSGRGRNVAHGYHPVQLAPAVDPHAYVWTSKKTDLDGQVAEMRVDGMVSERKGGLATRLSLKMIRLRTDRAGDVAAGGYFGNDYGVASQVISEALHPLKEAELSGGPAGDYFAEKKRSEYRDATAFTSMVKSRRINAQFAGSQWVIDLACGKGQDLGRYIDAGVQNLVGIDRDAAALAEIVSRHNAPKRRGRHGASSASSANPLRLYVIRADLGSTPPAALESALQRIGAAGASGVVCNLAAHYFAGSAASLELFARQCAVVLAPGGVASLTVMRGEAVHARLAADGTTDARGKRTWIASENGQVKYKIEDRFGGDPLAAAGQKIGVLLPFSRGELYEEFLLNTAALTTAFEVAGFELVEEKPFTEHLKEQGGAKKRLTPADISHLELYGELVYRRLS